MAGKRRRKRDLDLRDFWPWYESHTSITPGMHAQPPPFGLGELHDDANDVPLPASARKLLQIFYIVVTVVLIVAVVYGIFH